MFLRFSLIWKDKWAKDNDDIGTKMALWEWDTAISHLSIKNIDTAIDYCKLNFEWPPSIAEFLKICDVLSGIPAEDEILQLAIRRDFSNIIVKQIFDEIGSWAFSHDSEILLKKKIKNIYDKVRNQSRFKLLGKE